MKEFIVPSEDEGSRIDLFLTGHFLSASRGDISRAINNRLILVNGKTIKPSYKIREGDIIHAELLVSPEHLESNSDIDFEIIEEQDSFIIINKPAGLQVHPDAVNKTNTLANGLIAKFPEISAVHDDTTNGYTRPGIVHRLDRDTSGIMVIAKTIEVLLSLKKSFHDRALEKKYLALVWGSPKDAIGKIDKPLAKSADYSKQVIATRRTKTTIRSASTSYKLLRSVGPMSLLEAKPYTGRTHQIRVHLASIDCPIVGDPLYTPTVIRKINPESYPRLMLHATELSFSLFGSNYHFSIPLPVDFQSVIRTVDVQQKTR